MSEKIANKTCKKENVQMKASIRENEKTLLVFQKGVSIPIDQARMASVHYIQYKWTDYFSCNSRKLWEDRICMCVYVLLSYEVCSDLDNRRPIFEPFVTDSGSKTGTERGRHWQTDGLLFFVSTTYVSMCKCMCVCEHFKGTWREKNVSPRNEN